MSRTHLQVSLRLPATNLQSFRARGSPSVVPGSTAAVAAAAAPERETLTEMQIPRPHLRLTESESLGVRPIDLCFSETPGRFWWTLKFENHYLESGSWYYNFYLEIVVKIKVHWLSCTFIKYISISKISGTYCLWTFIFFAIITFCSFSPPLATPSRHPLLR